MNGKVEYGSYTIKYNIKFSNRKTLGIKVYPSGDVEVLAPVNTTMELIEQRILRRAFQEKALYMIKKNKNKNKKQT